MREEGHLAKECRASDEVAAAHRIKYLGTEGKGDMSGEGDKPQGADGKEDERPEG